MHSSHGRICTLEKFEDLIQILVNHDSSVFTFHHHIILRPQEERNTSNQANDCDVDRKGCERATATIPRSHRHRFAGYTQGAKQQDSHD